MRHRVGPARVSRHEVDQRLRGALRRRAGGRGRRQLAHVVGQVREHRADLTEGVLLVFGFVVDAARFVDVDVGAAELFVGHLVTDAAPHDGWAGGEHRRAAAGHHAPVDHHRAPGRAAGDRPEHAGQHGDVLHRLDRGQERGPAAVRQVGRAHLLGRRHVRAGPVDQQNQRHFVFDRELLGEAPEAALGALHREERGAALNREVFAADRDGAAIDLAEPHHVRGRREADQLAVVVLAESRERPDFVERAGVEQAVDPLTNGQPAQTVLALNSLGSAAARGQGGASAQFFNFGFPDHRVLPPWALSAASV